MDFHDRLLRITVEAIVGRMIRDIENDTDRSIRKAIDLGSYFAKGELQKEFFELSGDIASAPQSPYYQLIRRGVHTIDDDVLKTVGVNLGVTSFTFGMHQIRIEYAKTGRSMPWLRTFDYSGPENILPQDDLESRIEKDGESGAYAFAFRILHCRQALLPVLETAAHYKDCTFILEADPGCIGEDEAARILAAKNTAVLIVIDGLAGDPDKRKKAEAFRILRQYHLLYGFLFHYGEGVAAETSDKFLGEMIGCGCFTGVYLETERKGQSESDDAHPVYNFVCAARKQGMQPILLFDYRRDVEYIQDLILQKRHFTVKP